MAITTDTIKELRDITGISVMQCKKALEESDGDMDKAVILLRKKGAKDAEKKSDRTLGAGAIAAYIHGNGSVGAMVELSCETDFVSKNEEFRQVAYDIAMHIAAQNPKYKAEKDIPEADKEKAKEVFIKEVADKPDDMKEKILEGKLASHFKEQVLLDQTFIKNPELTIADLVQNAVQKFGEKVEISHFVRLSTIDS
ncbi:MAG: elongation factor Ts [Parcubacteria group bacterium CG11_big_fil_rev_8_21_14_0_20_39_22]|nr:MAG: elongation factor Ts [Parcubacteria group bacterium CG11_big_fil_rev_8_21_14_0_20_39_22]